MKFPYLSVVVLLTSIDAALSGSEPSDGDGKSENEFPLTVGMIQGVKVISSAISGVPLTKSPTTGSPTVQPTTFPTSKPSRNPTRTPTISPTASPTYRPTSKAPTASPSRTPTTETPTASPTALRKTECRIRMYYEKSYCWHDDAKNTKCKEDYEFCIAKSGDGVVLQKCGKTGGQKWRVIGHTVRPEKDKSLCWTRTATGLDLKKCGLEGKNQRFTGVCSEKKEIKPMGEYNYCLTSGHEPRKEERCRFQRCDLPTSRNTHRWETDRRV